MSYNQKFYNTTRNQQNNEFTFRGTAPLPYSHLLSHQPLPPLLAQNQSLNLSDDQCIKRWENISNARPMKKQPREHRSIGFIREQFRNIAQTVQNLKEKEIYLRDKMDILSEDEWRENMDQIKKHKVSINTFVNEFNDGYIESLRNVLAKRSAKRMRQKRLRVELKKEKEIKTKEREERSREIDENLQKVKNAIAKAKQEEDLKAQADIFLRDVLRKKLDAKKSIAKLEALVKLRKARQNTAKGRGEDISEGGAQSFNISIEKLKTLWLQKLSQYEKEESELRLKLKEDSKGTDSSCTKEEYVVQNLAKWREFLFGDGHAMPHRDFQGDRNSFVAVRSQWDMFLSSDGTPLPVGWVLP